MEPKLTQTLPWWLGGRGKDDRKQNTLYKLQYVSRSRLFSTNLVVPNIVNTVKIITSLARKTVLVHLDFLISLGPDMICRLSDLLSSLFTKQFV